MDAVTEIPTTALAATQVVVPATLTYTFDLRPGRGWHVAGAAVHLDLYRDGTLVAMAVERDGRTFLLSLGFGADARRRERRILSGWVADFAAAGLLPSTGLPYREYCVAQILLAEARALISLNRGRAPRFAASLEHVRRGEITTPPHSAGWCRGQIRQYLDHHPTAVMWDRRQESWSR